MAHQFEYTWGAPRKEISLVVPPKNLQSKRAYTGCERREVVICGRFS